MQQPTPNYDKDDTGSNITNRSAKFYNGTYAWCDEGYEDEKGGTHFFPSFTEAVYLAEYLTQI